MRILIVRTDALGDAVVSSPFIEVLHNSIPDLQLDILCTVYNSAAFEHNPFLKNKFILNHEQGVKRLANNLDVVMDGVNAYFYDMVLVLNGCYRTFLYAKLVRSRKIIARSLITKSFKAKIFIAKHKITSQFMFFNESRLEHEVIRLDAFCDFVLSSLNIQRVYSLPTIARFYLANKISLNQVNNSIIINASGKANESRYLNDSLLFALILCLGSKFQDLAIIVTPDDKSRVCNILKSVDPINQSINIICDKDIFAVAGEISKYQYFIGTDGGMAHIAAGLGLKSVILFDRQLTEIWHPWTPHQISLRSSRGNIYDVSYLDILQSISKLISKE